MAAVNLSFEMSIKSTLNGFLLQMLRSIALEITSCVYTKTIIPWIEVNRGRIFSSISKKNCSWFVVAVHGSEN